MRYRLSLRLSSSGIAFGEYDSNVLSALQIALSEIWGCSVVFGFLEEICAVLTKLLIIQGSQRSRFDTGLIKTLGTRVRYLNSILYILIFDSHSEEILISLCVVFGRFLLGTVIYYKLLKPWSLMVIQWITYYGGIFLILQYWIFSSMSTLPLDKWSNDPVEHHLAIFCKV